MSQNELSEADLSGLILEPSTIGRSRGVYERFLKRSVDVLLSGVALVGLSPILALTWIGLRLTLGPSVMLTQDRVGYRGQTFQMYKFRTMQSDRRAGSVQFDGHDRRRTHKSADDPRHTRFGRFLRSTSIDEIPQLLNVLRGQMSLVGPRPEMYYVAKKNGILDHPRHMVRPGLTGVFQTSGLRGKGDLSEGLPLDMAYVIDVSFLTDLKIVVRTLGALVRRTGV
jgi:lipopolysaccharide/colanic/teichoic acid biosynthesis glycosyltransferase